MAHLAIEFAVQINIGHVLAEAMTNLAWAYHLQRDELEAKKKFEDAETLSSAFGHPHLYSLRVLVRNISCTRAGDISGSKRSRNKHLPLHNDRLGKGKRYGGRG